MIQGKQVWEVKKDAQNLTERLSHLNISQNEIRHEDNEISQHDEDLMSPAEVSDELKKQVAKFSVVSRYLHESMRSLMINFSDNTIMGKSRDSSTKSVSSSIIHTLDSLYPTPTSNLIEHVPQWGLLGNAKILQEDVFGHKETKVPLILNTSVPFCAVAVGVQGSGKSHTVAALIENCLLSCPSVSHVVKPPKTLVFHYDTDENNFCEVATLTMPNKNITPKLKPHVQGVRKLTILVSPSFFLKRFNYYSNWPNCTVVPLLFKWKDLTASQLKSLMRINDTEEQTPLYMSVLLEMLRKYQKVGRFPSYSRFKDELEDQDYTKQQSAPLKHRIALLESFLQDSDTNSWLLKYHVPLTELFEDDGMVIVDMTDPMLSPSEANGIFKVILSDFQSYHSSNKNGKLVVFDEAHKYMSNSTSSTKISSALSNTIVQIVRQMRHHGIRVIVSTQSPSGLPSELLELVSIAIIHRFHSRDWFKYLDSKIPFDGNAFNDILELETGDALVFCSKYSKSLELKYLAMEDQENKKSTLKVRIRTRLTADGGESSVIEA